MVALDETSSSKVNVPSKPKAPAPPPNCKPATSMKLEFHEIFLEVTSLKVSKPILKMPYSKSALPGVYLNAPVN